MSAKSESKTILLEAYAEAGRYIRFFENFSWIFSTSLIIGTVGSVYKFLELFEFISVQWLFFLIILALVWSAFIKFQRDINVRTAFFIDRANNLETDLGFDIIPESSVEGPTFKSIMEFSALAIAIFSFGGASFIFCTLIAGEDTMKNEKAESIVEITHESYRCMMATCPAIFLGENDNYLIVGDLKEASSLPKEVAAKVGQGEVVISISRDLLNKSVKSLDGG